MSNRIVELRHIFGLKLREIRLEKGITYQALSQDSGLSVSYLSEIESGKKYPKGDKILLLASSLDVPYDELVSLKVPKKLQPVVDLMESNFIRDFPLEKFGINYQKLVEIVAQDPAKTNAFISTIMRISRNFEMKQAQFNVAALRSYRELHNNYFEELEDTVSELHLEFTELQDIPFQPEVLEDILLKIGVRTDFEELANKPNLKDVRSVYHPRQRLLHINKGLTKGQKNFLLGREIAFQWLRLKQRPLATPFLGKVTFEELLNNFFASYFSAALIIPRDNIIEDFRTISKMDKWNPQALTGLVDRYDATPEMVMQRLTSILPTYFDFANLYFLRFVKSGDLIDLTKELHLSTQHNPHANELSEHYCRRWLGIRTLLDLEKQRKKKVGLIGEAQRSKFHTSGNEYFGLSMAFPNVSNPDESISVTVGFLNNKTLQKKLGFVSDEDIEDREVNVTCERCGITDCLQRAESPALFEQSERAKAVMAEIDEIVSK